MELMITTAINYLYTRLAADIDRTSTAANTTLNATNTRPTSELSNQIAVVNTRVSRLQQQPQEHNPQLTVGRFSNVPIPIFQPPKREKVKKGKKGGDAAPPPQTQN